jgi:hypothetical protein
MNKLNEEKYKLKHFFEKGIYKKYLVDFKIYKDHRETIYDFLGGINQDEKHKMFYFDDNYNIVNQDSMYYIVLMYIFYEYNKPKKQQQTNNQLMFILENYNLIEDENNDIMNNLSVLYKLIDKRIKNTVNLYFKDSFENDHKEITKFLQKVYNLEIEFIAIKFAPQNEIDPKFTMRSTYKFMHRLFKSNPSEYDSIRQTEILDNFIKLSQNFNQISDINSFDNIFPLIFIKSIFDNTNDVNGLLTDEEKKSENTKEEQIDSISNKFKLKKLVKNNLSNILDTIIPIIEFQVTEVEKEFQKKTVFNSINSVLQNELDKFISAVKDFIKLSQNDKNKAYIYFGFSDSLLIPFIIFLKQDEKFDGNFIHIFKLLNLLLKMNVDIVIEKSENKHIKLEVSFKNQQFDFLKFIVLKQFDKLEDRLKKLISKAVLNEKKLKLLLGQLRYNFSDMSYKKLVLLPNILESSDLNKFKSIKRLLNELETEHILSQGITDFSHYGFESEEEFFELVHSIGNLTLLDKETNKNLPIDPFKKIEKYEEHELEHLQELAKEIKEYYSNNKRFKEFILKRKEHMLNFYIESYKKLF